MGTSLASCTLQKSVEMKNYLLENKLFLIIHGLAGRYKSQQSTEEDIQRRREKTQAGCTVGLRREQRQGVNKS